MRVQEKVIEAVEEETGLVRKRPEHPITPANLTSLVAQGTGFPEAFRQMVRGLLRMMEGSFPRERDWDEIGRRLVGQMRRAENVMREMVTEVAWYVNFTGQHVGNLDALATSADELAAFRQRIIEQWPWPDRPFPRLDAEKLARAREDIEHNRFENVRDVIERLRSGGPLRKE
jgi:hypothetical protein